MSERPRPISGEKTLGIHRDNLKPEVRKYGDNLVAQVLTIFRESGANDMPEFTAKLQAKLISPKTANKVEQLLEALQRAYRSDTLPEHLESLPESGLEQDLNLKEQYDSVTQLLERTHLLQELPTLKTLGIIGLDGQEYPLPSYRTLQERIQLREQALTLKANQGFKRLLIVPFGRKLL